ncbi:MAG TPA: acetamidase/formamidase family protein [Thermomicrobiales bacterium]|nr:acetamidase/formamidase family protein [Thermomicrobiales bacterium]
MATHQIEPTRETLHGHFSRELLPILTIDSGDTVRFRTLDARWGMEPPGADGTAAKQFAPRDPERDKGHALCGPVAIRGAEPGMTIEVEIGQLRTGTWGWNLAGGFDSSVNERLGFGKDHPEHRLRWTLDPDRGVAQDHRGREVALRPFLGVIGMPPAERGIHPTAPPRPTGGNIDCKELFSGSRVFLPVAVPGGLISAGDGHGAQGDGEASGTAIECPMERVDLTLRLHPELRLTTPRARTASAWITFGFDEDLDEAMAIALDAMLDLMGELHGFERADALALASVVVDLRITQVVNGVRGVHAVLADDAFSLSAP